MRYMLGELLKNTLGDQFEYRQEYDIPVADICMDSRQVRQGAIFVAIPGSRVRGSAFLGQAVERGASAAVVPQEELASIDVTLMPPDFPVIPVSDVRYFVGCAADLIYDHPSDRLSLIGITGTNGKTTVSWLLESILHSAGMNPGVIGTISQRFAGRQRPSDLTTPDAISLQRKLAEMVDSGVDSCLLEVSSHALDQKRVAGCRFAIALFTNLSRDHIDYHRCMEDYYQAKKLLFTQYAPESIVINTDDSYGARLVEELAELGRSPVTYGIGGAMVAPEHYSMELSGIQAVIRTPSGSYSVRSRLVGLHNLSNILAAAAVAHVLGIDHHAVSRGIESVSSVPGRLERVDVPDGYMVLVDYAHTPDAMEKVLHNLRELASNRLIVVAGCGGDRDRGKRPLMAQGVAAMSDVAFFTSDNPRTEAPKEILHDMVDGIDTVRVRSHIHVVPERYEAIRQAVSEVQEGDCLLIAGKGHEDYQIIGSSKRAFDDRQVVRHAFDLKLYAESETVPAVCADAAGPVSYSEVAQDITMAQVAQGMGAVSMTGPRAMLYTGLCTDTRNIRPGQLFWALRGENFNGNRFAASALAAGACGVVIDSSGLGFLNPNDYTDKCIITVRDTLKALGDFASWFRRQYGYRVFGITGSCGKTTTRSLISAVASTMYPVAETMENFNNLIGLPLSMLSARPETVWGVFEMGMNQPGEMARLCRISQPDIGLITNIGAAHLERLGSLEGVAAQKWELWKAIPEHGAAVVNLDDPLVLQGLKHLRCKRILGWTLGFGDKDIMNKIADTYLGGQAGPETFETVVTCDSWRPDGAGTEVVCTISRNDGSSEQLSIKLPLLGEANVQNAIAAVAAGAALHVPLDQIRQGLQDASGVPVRLEYRELANHWLVIMDFYNANPTSMKAALATLSVWAGQRRKVAILGDMLELGDHSVRLHRELGTTTAAAGVDMLLVAGRFASEVAAGARAAGMPEAGIKIFPHTEDMCAWLRDRAVTVIPDRAALLVKGSRGMRLEDAVDVIEQVAGGSMQCRSETSSGGE